MNPIATVERYLPLERLSSWALFGAGCGLIAEIGVLPELVRALLLLTFVLVGPGSVVLGLVPPLPLVAVRALVPVTGLSVVILAVSGGLLLGFWSSRLTLLVLVVLTAGGGLIDRRRAAAAAGATGAAAVPAEVRPGASASSGVAP